MELCNYEQSKNQSHYEYVIHDALCGKEKVKQLSFRAMDVLEGWCTKKKASVLIDLVLMAQPETIVEIGVFGGKSLIPMAYALKENGRGKIYGIDPWEKEYSVVGWDDANKEWWENVDHEAILFGLQEKIEDFKLQNQIQLIRTTSELAQPIPNIDILHIDGNHSEETSVFDVTKWVPLVKRGGFIIFDDEDWNSTKKAQSLMEEYCVRLGEFKDNNVFGIWMKL